MSAGASRCVHEMSIESCALCGSARGSAARQVVISGGGQVFHSSSACDLLREGQEKVIRRGGQVEKIDRVPYTEALYIGREPCRGCYPGGWPEVEASASA
jgi:hypothetical protein